jgi:hypothetical protein
MDKLMRDLINRAENLKMIYPDRTYYVIVGDTKLTVVSELALENYYWFVSDKDILYATD